jgi:hypothetical protein
VLQYDVSFEIWKWNVCFQHFVVQHTGYLAATVVHFGVVTSYQKEINITVILDTDYHLITLASGEIERHDRSPVRC